MLLQKLAGANLIHPPKWLIANTQYLTIMGSAAYGVDGSSSDVDVYGFCIPPKELVFPHLAGEIPGFGRQIQRFEQWSEHHVRHPDREVEYDFAVYGIVKYFHLCMENNPNMLDSIFTPRRCVLHSTVIGEHVRANRRLFLHKGAWHKFKGYAYSQASKIRNKVNYANEKRAADIEKYGYSTKFAYHLVRLLNEVEQIMVEHDLDLERNREQLKSIRRGEWTREQIEEYFAMKERSLEEVYAKSTLRHAPDEERIKQVLLECLEAHYGSLSTAVARNPSLDALIGDLRAVLDRYSPSA